MEYLIGHLVGDYLLQNDWMAKEKKRSHVACAIHVACYCLAVWCLHWMAANRNGNGRRSAFPDRSLVIRGVVHEPVRPERLYATADVSVVAHCRRQRNAPDVPVLYRNIHARRWGGTVKLPTTTNPGNGSRHSTNRIESWRAKIIAISYERARATAREHGLRLSTLEQAKIEQ